ncbi:MAG TPA: FHA domain-containing protein, partial [Candidatus Omnitrophota bacterium]|nr:FHA domain-containing protein [Candidatus Omnitrophota bacterium]
EVRLENIRISKEKLAYDDLILPQMIVQRYQDASGKGVSEEEAARRIFTALNDPAAANNLRPKHKFDVNGKTVYSSDPVLITQLGNRPAVVLYVVREDGRVDMRLAYKSNSQNEWRVASHLIRRDVENKDIHWIGKGEGEISMTLKIGMSDYLDSLTPVSNPALLSHALWIPVGISADIGLGKGIAFAESIVPEEPILDRLLRGKKGPFTRSGELKDSGDQPDYENGVVYDAAQYNEKFGQEIRTVTVRSKNGKYLYRFHHRAHPNPAKRVSWLGKVELAQGSVTNYGIDADPVPQDKEAVPGIDYEVQILGQVFRPFENDNVYCYNTEYTHKRPVVKGFIENIVQKLTPEEAEKRTKLDANYERAVDALKSTASSNPELFLKILKTLREGIEMIEGNVGDASLTYYDAEAFGAVRRAISESGLSELSDHENYIELEARLRSLEDGALERAVSPELEAIRGEVGTIEVALGVSEKDKIPIIDAQKASAAQLDDLMRQTENVGKRLFAVGSFAEGKPEFDLLKQRIGRIRSALEVESAERESIERAQRKYRKEFRQVSNWMLARGLSASQAAAVMREISTQIEEERQGEFLERIDISFEAIGYAKDLRKRINLKDPELIRALTGFYKRSGSGLEKDLIAELRVEPLDVDGESKPRLFKGTVEIVAGQTKFDVRLEDGRVLVSYSDPTAEGRIVTRDFEPGQVITVGRARTNSIRVLSTKLSREHFRFRVTKNGEFIGRDLESLNGTSIRWQPLTFVEMDAARERRVAEEEALAYDLDNFNRLAREYDIAVRSNSDPNRVSAMKK